MTRNNSRESDACTFSADDTETLVSRFKLLNPESGLCFALFGISTINFMLLYCSWSTLLQQQRQRQQQWQQQQQ